MNTLSHAGVALAVGIFVAVAADPPAKPEQVTVRVTGLFAPDRADTLRAAFAEIPDVALVAVDYDYAEATVEFVAAKAFPGAKPAEVVARLDNLVRGASGHTLGVKPRSAVPRDKLTEVVIPAAGLDCRACCLAAYEAVAGVDGVVRATASFKDGRVTARVDPAKADRAKLEEALKKRGVTVGKP